MKAAAVVIAKRRGEPLAMVRHAASSNNSRNPVMANALFLRNLWYFALHGDKLKKGRLQTKEILGERIVFGMSRLSVRSTWQGERRKAASKESVKILSRPGIKCARSGSYV